ncbi:MAG: nucleotidyltransferase domain-containing protein [Actinomycetota bacterium]|jgi:predicted nucleotidyltransferase|nr:nucleotidyltransferase domain-containing protein [Actinomycetota bacterium]
MATSPPSPVGGYELAGRLRECLVERPEVVVAYLFGSWARGTQTALSDIDVAVLLAPVADLRATTMELAADLSGVTGRARLDLVVLNDAPLALAYRVLRDGQLLACRDEVARVRHWAATVDRYPTWHQRAASRPPVCRVA